MVRAPARPRNPFPLVRVRRYDKRQQVLPNGRGWASGCLGPALPRRDVNPALTQVCSHPQPEKPKREALAQGSPDRTWQERRLPARSALPIISVTKLMNSERRGVIKN